MFHVQLSLTSSYLYLIYIWWMSLRSVRSMTMVHGRWTQSRFFLERYVHAMCPLHLSTCYYTYLWLLLFMLQDTASAEAREARTGYSFHHGHGRWFNEICVSVPRTSNFVND